MKLGGRDSEGLTLNHFPLFACLRYDIVGKWFNVKLSRGNWFNIKPSRGKGLTLNDLAAPEWFNVKP